LPLLREAASFARFEVNQWIFRERGKADAFYLIHEGRVAVETSVPEHGMTTIQRLGTGDALGWSWLLPPFRWHFSARALAPTELVALRSSYLLFKAKEFPEFGYELVLRVADVLSQRLRATRLQLAAATKGKAANGGDLLPK
jgi:CRP/FNR family cyclic AMP-dependent transcriptional regulator